MFKHYLLVSWHALKRRPLVALINLLGIVFTLAILMVCVNIVEGQLRPQGPEKNQHRLLYTNFVSLKGSQSSSEGEPGYAFLNNYLEGLAAPTTIYSGSRNISIYRDGLVSKYSVLEVDINFWQVFSFNVLTGRLFNEADRGTDIVVISRKTAEDNFGGIDVVGELLTVDARPFEVVAVLENVSTLEESTHADMWFPLWIRKDLSYLEKETDSFRAAILAENQTQATQLKRQFRNNVENYQATQNFTEALATLNTRYELMARDWLSKQAEWDSGVELFTSLAVLILITFITLPALNLINLNLSNIWERRSEVGLRKALGASTTEVVKQILAETLLLSVLGVLLALPLAKWLLSALQKTHVLENALLSISFYSVLWGVMFALVFGVLSGFYPAWKTARMNPATVLKGGM